ncbi:MAG TPA: ABC transporter substrate-binding protein [Burkholderiaceae bacterium]|jgi:peptide/nickel transport system substrate-binding protein|nr:ABC transporter substrate-binding protein [Burkholderiaceae bacterium]
MTVGLPRIRFRMRSLACGLALAVSIPFAAPAFAQGKVLKFVPEADLRSLDPIWTTAYITRNHGYMVYDVLFATDANFKIQPQMVDKWQVSDDKLTYTFTLRDGLKFHDGQPVRSADCIASIERWAKRDVFGQKLGEMTDSWTAVDDKTFRLKLKKPFPYVLEALGKPSSNVPFIMPERVAKTDAFTAITDATGSGPFKFVKEQWVPGSKVVYEKNADYVPRKEPPSWGAGGKVVKVDRVEWIYIPDAATAAAALNTGEVDWWQQVPVDLVPVLRRNKDIKVESVDPLGSIGLLRFNHLHPPFNNPKMRQAVAAVLDQQDYAIAIAGDPKNGKPCPSFFTCGTPMASTAGADVLTGKRDVDKAKQLVKEAGYKGEKIILMTATDQPIVHSQALVTQELLRKIGLNVELAASDWGTLITRRSSKEPIDKGGWSIFHTWFVGPDIVSPALNSPLRGAGEKSWFGWPSDDKLEELRNAWFDAPTEADQKKIAEQMQRRAFEVLPYIPTAQFIIPTAYRSNLSGVIISPVTFIWNVEKK